MTTTWTRRQMLGGMSMAGLAVAAAACTRSDGKVNAAGAATTDTLDIPSAATAMGGGSFLLFEQSDLEFQTLLALGAAGQNAEVGEVIAVVAEANSLGASYQTVYDAFVTMGNTLVGRAETAVKGGHTVTARASYIRAAQYFNQALYWVLGTSTPDGEAAAYKVMNDSFAAAAERMNPAWERFDIPYEGRTLPGWFARPSADAGRRPTLIMCNGSDGQNVDMVAQGGLSALERGYNIVIFEGPGQGSQLFLDNVVFRPDWEKVITPVVDSIISRADVDADKIALRGISFGGELCPRAAAFEPRIKALIADPGICDAWNSYPPIVTDVATVGTPAQVNEQWQNEIIDNVTDDQAFNLKKRFEIYTQAAHDDAKQGNVVTDFAALATAAQKFDNADVIDRITCPTLVTQYEDDTAFGTGGQTLYDGLKQVENKKLAKFTAAEGAQYHCGPMAPQFVAETMFDWLDDVFR